VISNYAFKFNLRRYTMGGPAPAPPHRANMLLPPMVWRCKLTLSNPP